MTGRTNGPVKRPFVPLVIVAIVALGVWLWMGLPLFGEPELRVNLVSPLPSEVSLGDTFEMVVEVINEGGGELRGLVIYLEMPEGFTSSVTGTNTRTVRLGSLSARDGVGWVFGVTVSKDILQGTYIIRITVEADNESPQTLTPSVKVMKK